MLRQLFINSLLQIRFKDVSPQLIELSYTPRSTTDLLFEGKDIYYHGWQLCCTKRGVER
jgi:hypothetical protein